METQNQKRRLPTFGDSFGNGWDVMSRFFLVLMLVVIVTGVVMAPMQFNGMNFKFDDSNFGWHELIDTIGWGGFAVLGAFAVVLGILAFLYTLLVVPVFRYGGDIMFVHAARGIRPEFETLIKGFKENYLNIILANLLTFALVMLGCILLLIPGIIVACRLIFVSYLVMDRKLDPIIAVEESWRLTKGHGWTIFAMGLVSIFIFMLGLIMLFVGTIPAVMWIKSSFASLYQAVLDEKNGAPVVAEA